MTVAAVAPDGAASRYTVTTGNNIISCHFRRSSSATISPHVMANDTVADCLTAGIFFKGPYGLLMQQLRKMHTSSLLECLLIQSMRKTALCL